MSSTIQQFDPERVLGTVKRPFGSVNSVRAIISGGGPKKEWWMVGRLGADGEKFGAPGGKLVFGEDMDERIATEVLEETMFTELFGLELLTTVYAPERTILYPVEKWRQLGYEAPAGYDALILANPFIFFYTAFTNEKLTRRRPEGRQVRWIRLNDGPDLKRNLKLIKPHHRKAVKAWRKWKESGIFPPARIEYRPKK